MAGIKRGDFVDIHFPLRKKIKAWWMGFPQPPDSGIVLGELEGSDAFVVATMENEHFVIGKEHCKKFEIVLEREESEDVIEKRIENYTSLAPQSDVNEGHHL